MTEDHKHPDDEPVGPDAARKLDEDAAWQAIVEHYGERPVIEPDQEPTDEPEPAQFPAFERRWEEPLESDASWADEGHFVPPVPPPLPQVDPPRRLAWAGLFGAPVVMIIGYVLGVTYPTWLLGIVVAGFFGGFGYLVATMPRDRPDDWSGDDGAVV